MLNWLTASVGSRPLGLARTIVGAAASIRALVGLPILLDLTRAETLQAPYAEWMPDPSVPVIAGLAGIWLLSAILFMLGWRVYVSGSVLFLCLVAVLVIDQQTYANHLYLMGWLVGLMTLADAGAGLNFRRVDRPVIRWPLLLLMLQGSIVYVFAALTKINTKFLSGEILAGLGTGIVPFPDSLRAPGLLSKLAFLVVVVELSVGMLIWLPRYRRIAFVLGVGLHTAIPLLMRPTAELVVFSFEMLALYPLFLDPDPLRVAAPHGYPIDRLARHDILRLIAVGSSHPGELTVRTRGATVTGTDARIRILEHLVPWLWTASILRLPVIKQIYGRVHTGRRLSGSAARIGQ